MSTAIIYTSSHGTTEKIANLIKNEIKNDDVKIIKLKLRELKQIDQFDQIILGTSIHAGRIPRNMQRFMDRNKELLHTKKLGLYLCCMYEGEQANEQFKNAFIPMLADSAVAKGILGGEFLFDKMNFLERAIVKKLTGHKKTVSRLKMDEIREFAKAFNN